MNTVTFNLEQKIVDFNGTQIRVLNIHIEISSEKIPIRSAPLAVVVLDGNRVVKSWLCQLSGNQKEVDAWFTTDAFTGFGSNCNIAIGHSGLSLYQIENVDITAFPPSPSVPGVTDATNAWLQNVIDNQ